MSVVRAMKKLWMPTKRSIFCHRFLFCCCVFFFPVEFLNKSEWIIVHLLVHFRVRSVQKSFSHTCTCCWLSCLSLSALLTMHILIALLSITRPLAYFRILIQYFAKKYTHSCTIHLCACVCVLSHENKYANAMTEHLFIIPCSQHKINYVRYDQSISWE